MDNSKYIVKSRFDDISLVIPINWRQNPYNNKNWIHHFMSLRWIALDKTNPQDLKLLLTDFYNYHIKKKSNNPHYNTIRGDHTAAERMNFLCRAYSKYESYNDLSLPGVIVRILKAEVENLLLEKMYRNGHNHALMVDIALINCFIEVLKLRHIIDLNYVIRRAQSTLLQMFYPDGTTRENSVSYQEYNYNVVKSFVVKINKLEKYVDFTLLSDLASFENIIKDETRKILGYSLRDDGTYLELGDTFTDPKPKILHLLNDDRLPSEALPKELLEPYSLNSGYYINKGLILYRYKGECKSIHFGQTVMYGSNNHKQNDELSFCLCINGEDIFIDPGYSTAISHEEQENLRSEFSHSTLNIIGNSWKSYESGEDSNQINDIKYKDNILSYKSVHKRIDNFTISLRTAISPTGLFLDYTSDSQTKIPRLRLNRFILASGCQVEILDRKNVLIKTENCKLRFSIANDVGNKTMIGDAVFIKFNSDLVTKKTKSIDVLYYSDHLKVEIAFLS